MGSIRILEASRRAGKSCSKGSGKVSFPSASLILIFLQRCRTHEQRVLRIMDARERFRAERAAAREKPKQRMGIQNRFHGR